MYLHSSLWDLIQRIDDDKTAFKIHVDSTIKNISYNVFRRRSKTVAQFLLNYVVSTADEAPTSTIGILVRNSCEGIMMIVGTYLANSTSVIVDIEKTPTERVHMIFQDASVRAVLVVDQEEENVQLLHGEFLVYAWADIVEEGNSLTCPIEAPKSESHPFAIYYTR